MERVLAGEPTSKRAWGADTVVLGDDMPESGCRHSPSAEGSRDSTRCSTLCWHSRAVRRPGGSDRAPRAPRALGHGTPLYHVLHGAQVLGAVAVAVVVGEVGRRVAVLVTDAEVGAIHHQDLAALERKGARGRAGGWPPASTRPPLAASPHLQLAILSSIVQRRAAPGIGSDLPTVQQQPAQHLGVAAAGGEVHGRGPLSIPLRQAHRREAHLRGQAG